MTLRYLDADEVTRLTPWPALIDAIRTANDQLNEAWQSASAELYKQAQQQQAQAGGAPGAEPAPGAAPEGGEPAGDQKSDEGPIIDAEVVDDKK